ncbi:MAG: hypothetical protein ACPG4T_16170 [Nannocystaceae bacterium]
MHESSIEDTLGRYGRELLAARAPEWEAFTRGELTEDEVVAARREHESQEELDEHLEMFRPFDAAQREHLVAQLLAHPDIGTPTKHVPTPSLPAATVIPLWRRPSMWATVAAAAVVAFMLIQPGIGPSGAPEADIPTFELEVSAGLASQRSDHGPSDQIPRYSPETEIEVVIRPKVRATQPLQVHLFAFQGEHGQKLATPIEVAASGSVRLKGQVGETLGLEAGSWRLVFVVGDGQDLPSDPADVRALAGHQSHPGQAGGAVWVESLAIEIANP